MIQLISSILFAANTICVPSDYSTIADAISNAGDGDTVLVADGVYEISAQLEVIKPITLKSENGAGATIITNTVVVPAKPNAQAVCRCILVDNAGAVVNGFTFAGGYLYDNGTTRTGPDGFGAGVYLNSGKLLNSTVTHCRMGKSKCGGSLAMMSMSAFASNCVITANESLPDSYGYEVRGVGLYAVAGEMVDSEISDNVYKGSPYPRGAGVAVADSGDNAISFTMRRCRILRNVCRNASYVSYWGAPGGLWCEGRNPLYENLLIAGNSTPANGGGVWLGFSNYTNKKFVNCTIVDNTAGYGGGVDDYSGYGRFYNCIVQDNHVTAGDTSDWKPESRGNSRFYYCLSPVDYTTKANCSDCIIGSATFKNGTYELAAGSLGYDAGSTNTFPWLATTVDLNGDPRIWNPQAGGAIDIGCYEYSVNGLDVSVTRDVTADAFIEGTTVNFTGHVLPEGSSFTCAWKIDGVTVGTETVLGKSFDALGEHTVEFVVTAASGEYAADPITVLVQPKTLYVVESSKHPGHVAVPPYASAANAATNIADAVAAAGNGSTVHVEEGEYVLAQEILIEKGVKLMAGDDCSRTVIRRRSGNMRLLNLSHADAVLSGFTFRDGYHNVSGNYGGGVLIRAGGTLTNCTITACTLSSVQQHYGAGLYMEDGLVVDCDITDNTNRVNDATYRHGYGAGVYIGSGELRNCRILRNAMVVNTENGNHCQPGGGVFADGGKLVGCLIADNFCSGSGGGIYVKSPVIVSNCTVTGNSAYSGSGLAVEAGMTTCNTAVAGNVSVTGGQITCDPAKVAFTYCFGPEGELPAGEGNVFGTDAKFYRGTYRPGAGSPLCDAGVYADWMATATDLRGRPRATGRHTVDIGCYQANHNGFTVIFR